MHQQNDIDASSLLVFLMLFITIIPVFKRLLRVSITWEMGNISFEKLLNIFELAETKIQLPLSKFELIKGHIQFQEVSFSYDCYQRVLDNVTLDILGSGITIINGKMASGKSSMIKLLKGAYATNSGKITIDGQDINTLDKKSLRKHLAIVSEDYPLIGRTVFEAISYSRKAKKEKEAKAILELLFSASKKLKQPNLTDKIGDLGSNLSKGQQKLLTYARAFLTKKKILLIDEPFDGLDIETEKAIAELLTSLATEKTIVLFTQETEKVNALIANYKLQIRNYDL